MAKSNDMDVDHPRQHSLAMASADTLHKAGYISSAHRDLIRKSAGKKLDTHKASKEAAFGSLAPQSAGHYLPSPAPPEDDQGGM